VQLRACEPLRVWNRLEPRPRRVDLADVLQARVHDPLWMLTRQWQFGEFHGEDTGSPVLARVARRAFPVSAVRTGGQSQAYSAADQPLEPVVEQLPVPFTATVRAQCGQYAMTLLRELLLPGGAGSDDAAEAALAAIRAALVAAYTLDRLELDPSRADHALALARRRSAPAADRALTALARRAVDGVQLAEDMLVPGASGTWTDLPTEVVLAVPAADADDVLGVMHDYRDWFAAQWRAPSATQASAWDGERLEYVHGCTVSRGTGVDLVGAPSSSGRLDWYSFDLDAAPDSPPGADGVDWDVATAIPVPAAFAGQPAARWWQLEDGAVSLTGLRADSGDLAKLLVTDFALVYGNNWMLIPYEQPLGTLCEVGGIVVDDVFGVRTLVGPATGASGRQWDSWDLFSLAPRGPGGHPVLGQHLFLPPVLSAVLEGPPVEEVVLVRDEATNNVWGVESRVPDGVHGSLDGAAVARDVTAALVVLEQGQAAAESGGAGASGDAGGAGGGGGGNEPANLPALVYRVGTTVPRNWIPFLPVHRPSSTHEIRLQRASMPQLFPPLAPRVRPVTTVLRTGLADPGPRSGRYPEVLEGADDQDSLAFVNEEEVPRSGVVVRSRMQRARWFGGTAFLWHGRQVSSGRGEGSSGLRYDVLEAPDGQT